MLSHYFYPRNVHGLSANYHSNIHVPNDVLLATRDLMGRKVKLHVYFDVVCSVKPL